MGGSMRDAVRSELAFVVDQVMCIKFEQGMTMLINKTQIKKVTSGQVIWIVESGQGVKNDNGVLCLPLCFKRIVKGSHNIPADQLNALTHVHKFTSEELQNLGVSHSAWVCEFDVVRAVAPAKLVPRRRGNPKYFGFKMSECRQQVAVGRSFFRTGMSPRGRQPCQAADLPDSTMTNLPTSSTIVTPSTSQPGTATLTPSVQVASPPVQALPLAVAPPQMPRLACASPAHAPHALKPEEVGLATAAAALLDQGTVPDPVALAPPVPSQPPALPPALPATLPASVPAHLQLSGAVPAPPLAAASSVTRQALPTFSASASARPRCPKVVRTLEDMFSWAADFYRHQH